MSEPQPVEGETKGEFFARYPESTNDELNPIWYRHLGQVQEAVQSPEVPAQDEDTTDEPATE